MKKDITIGTFSSGLYKNSSIRTLYKISNILLKPDKKQAESIDLMIGWGRKVNTHESVEYSHANNIPYFTLEDGFIHSMSQGRLGAVSWSLVVDKLGIFYDATSRSSLEQLIIENNLTEEEVNKARSSIDFIIRHAVTKYNNGSQLIPEFIKHLKKPVLVVDQVLGDMSIPYALADQKSFDEMYAAARVENPDSDIIVKIHPDVINGKRRGCITLPKKLPPNIHLISDNLNPIRLMDHIEKVYVVSSQLGFEALLLKKEVVCFGAPFYAGWGLTDDRPDSSFEVFKRRGVIPPPSLEVVFYAAYYQYTHYFHPDTNELCQLEDILEYTKFQYCIQQKLTKKLFCLGFTPWKKRFMTHYLKTPDNQVFFVKTEEQALTSGFDNNSIICLWSTRFEAEAQKLLKRFDTSIWRIEDGFIRSVTLGSNYAPPASLVIDKNGLYFDPTQPSDLENILLETTFDEELISRSKKLKQQLIHKGISKYNGGDRGLAELFAGSKGRKVLLVPGQVSDDASILKGCRDISDNLSLIKIVRENNPEAYVVYKPHPDVLSGNRKGHIEEEDLAKYCDQVVLTASITDCLSQAHEVHTMTSLVGFEALLRNLTVYCYGIPFYSGWGLTVDRHTCSRRNRVLSVDELAAGTLIKYPLYMNWETHHFTTPEQVTDAIHSRLTQQKPQRYSDVQVPVFLKKIRKKISLLKTMLNPKLK